MLTKHLDPIKGKVYTLDIIIIMLYIHTPSRAFQNVFTEVVLYKSSN